VDCEDSELWVDSSDDDDDEEDSDVPDDVLRFSDVVDCSPLVVESDDSEECEDWLLDDEPSASLEVDCDDSELWVDSSESAVVQ